MASPVTVRALLLLFALAALWAGSFTLIKVAVATMPPFSVAAGRVAIAAIALIGFVYLRGERMAAPVRIWGLLIWIGLLGSSAPFALIHWGETHIDSGLAAILMAIVPLFTVLIAHAFTRAERLSVGKLAGILMGLAGVVLLVGVDAVAGLGAHAVAELAIVVAALSYAVTNVLSLGLHAQSPAVSSAGSMVTAVLFSVPAAFIFESPWQLTPSLSAILVVGALGLFATALAWVIYFHLVRTMGATFTALTNYILPPLGVLWGMLFLAERPGTNAYLALGLILAGIAITNLDIHRSARRAALGGN